MNAADAPTFAERFDRFIRWFFTASPEAGLAPLRPASASSRTVSQHRPAHVRPRHGGPVRIVTKGKS
jgi:hypothetical protein